MRIAVNTRLLLSNRLEGIGVFTFENLSRICKNNPEHEFFFIFDRPYDDSFIFNDNITPIVIGPQARHPILFLIWFEISVRHILKKHNIDIFLSPDGFLPLGGKTKSIAVIHDLNFEHYPGFVSKTHYYFYKNFMPRYARKADHIITVSNYSKKDIIDLYNIKKEKISVAYNGVSEEFKTYNQEVKDDIKKKYTNSKDFFIYLGAIHPRKNLIRLLYAFDKFKEKTKGDEKMLIVGKKMFNNSDLEKVYENLKHKSDIIFTGYIEVNTLSKLISSALALTFVPIFEGFGIPIIEAFASGTAVITSNKTSMPEVGGDAAIIVDPFSIDEISEAMVKISSDDVLRSNLIEKGFKRLEMFSWEKSAKQIMQSIKDVAD